MPPERTARRRSLVWSEWLPHGDAPNRWAIAWASTSGAPSRTSCSSPRTRERSSSRRCRRCPRILPKASWTGSRRSWRAPAPRPRTWPTWPTAPRSPPTPCCSVTGLAPRSSPRAASAICSRSPASAVRRSTICTRRSPVPSCAGSSGARCRSGSRPTAACGSRSTSRPWTACSTSWRARTSRPSPSASSTPSSIPSTSAPSWSARDGGCPAWP